jgi:hypothetical protein
VGHLQDVISGPAVQLVGTRRGCVDPVVAVAAVEGVVARACGQVVIALAAIDDVVAKGVLEFVVPRRALDYLIGRSRAVG